MSDRYEALAARYLAALAKRDMAVWQRRVNSSAVLEEIAVDGAPVNSKPSASK
jgi:hypothetical protein